MYCLLSVEWGGGVVVLVTRGGRVEVAGVEVAGMEALFVLSVDYG